MALQLFFTTEKPELQDESDSKDSDTFRPLGKGSVSEEMYREQSFCSTQTGSWTTASSSSDNLSRFRGSNTSRDYKLKMMVKAFLESNGFLHVNEPQHSWGRTRYPLHVAVSQNKPAIVKALLLLGAWRNVKTRRGLTPEDLARRSGFEEVLNVLEQATLQKESTLESSQSQSRRTLQM
ncbi:ANK2 [Symbiodinium microadriaticum]|nr:ANK2 [Symbiodinium sp. KB8]CAE7204266.1 ANK2 [Symbiodinium microadriaticum]